MNVLFYGFRHVHLRDYYTKAVNHPDYRIVAALEEDPHYRKLAEDHHGVVFSEGTYEQWLENPDVEVVAIGTAYGDRGPAVIKALQHGKHVLSDKPICTNLEELEEIRALATEKHLKVGCLLDLKYTPSILPVKELLDSGRMGKVKNITFNGQHCIDYANRPSWYFEPGMHGGTINDIAIHGIDIIPYLTGQKITKLHAARTWNSFATRHPHFMDCAVFMAETDGGAGVQADVSYAAPSQVFSMPTYWSFQIWCERGLVTFCAVNHDVTVYEEGIKEPQIISGKDHTIDMLTEFVREWQSAEAVMTQRVLESTQTALLIQKAANEAKGATNL